MEYMGQYGYSNDATKLCLTKKECSDDHDGYVYSEHCVSAEKCKNDSRYAYLQTRECLATTPDDKGGFDSEKEKSFVYSCGSKYLDLTGDEAKCIDNTTCSGILYKSLQACVKQEACANPGSYNGFVFEDEFGKQCVSARSAERTSTDTRTRPEGSASP